jgi:hypothetical protein
VTAGFVVSANGWPSYLSPCGCEYTFWAAFLINVCRAHESYAGTALNAAGILLRMRLSVKAEAEEREAA